MRIVAVVSRDTDIKRRKSSRACFHDELSIHVWIWFYRARDAGRQMNASENNRVQSKVLHVPRCSYAYRWSVVDEDSSWCAISLFPSTSLAFCEDSSWPNRLHLSIYPIFSSLVYFHLRSPPLFFIPLFSNIYSAQRIQNKNAVINLNAWTIKYKTL